MEEKEALNKYLPEAAKDNRADIKVSESNGDTELSGEQWISWVPYMDLFHRVDSKPVCGIVSGSAGRKDTVG